MISVTYFVNAPEKGESDTPIERTIKIYVTSPEDNPLALTTAANPPWRREYKIKFRIHLTERDDSQLTN